MIAQLDKNIVKMRPLLVPRRLISYTFFEGRPLTTRGQWINPLLLFMFERVKSVPAIKIVKAPIYILGAGRSGTTILGKLFHMHPQCGFLNEPKAMWHSIYPYEDLIGSYSRQKATYRLGETDVTPEIREVIERLYGFYLLIVGAQRVVDKYPEMIFRVPFLRAIFPDAKFVFLIRNGLDTLRSISTWSNMHSDYAGSEKHDWWGVERRKWRLLLEQVVAQDPILSQHLGEISNFSRPENMAAIEWIVTAREGLHLMKNIPSEIHLIRYENLVKNPTETILDLLEFCQLKPDEIMLEYAHRVLSPPQPKNPVNLHHSITQAFNDTMSAMNYPLE